MSEDPKLTEEFSKVFPTLSPKELREAEYNFRRYLEIAQEIVLEAKSNHAIEDRGSPADLPPKAN